MGKVEQVVNGGTGWVSIVNLAARRGCITDNYFIRRPLDYRGTIIRHCSNPFMQHVEEMLRINMLFNWLTGEFGPIDDFTITRDHVTCMFEELLGYPSLPHGVINTVMIGKELKFWDHILHGERRKNPLEVPE